MFASFVVVLSFISIIPVPQKILPLWDSSSLRWFCVMLPAVGLVFGLLWFAVWKVLTLADVLSPLLRGFIMMMFTLCLTGGLHMDGLMDTCDAVFSHRDRETRLKILSDTHAGSFAVMGCVVVILAKTLLFSELLTLTPNPYSLIPIPVFSRLGMGFMLNSLPFAKNDGLAATLGSARNERDNVFFVLMIILLLPLRTLTPALSFCLCLLFWRRMCLKLFGGITGDLLGAFVEASEVMMLLGMVIESACYSWWQVSGQTCLR